MKFDGHGHLDTLATVDRYELVLAISERGEQATHATTAGKAGTEPEVAQWVMSAAIRAEREIVTLRERVRCLERLVSTDELTGVLNRRGFEAELQRTLDLARRHGETGALLFIDLDDFKQVNDTYGHAAGDEVLRQIAILLKQNVRRSDVVARLGGDEFVVLLIKACVAGGNSRRIALEQSLRSTVVHWCDRVIKVGASVGACRYGPGDQCDALIRDADEKMYAQKPHRISRDKRSEGPVAHRSGKPVPAQAVGNMMS